MENKLNMVIIDKDEYYELRKFKEKIIDGDCYVYVNNGAYFRETKFYTECEAIKILAKVCDEYRSIDIPSLNKYIDQLLKEIETLKAKKENMFVRSWKYLFNK